jgi:tetratricopeptide (TPR) repeat protein
MKRKKLETIITTSVFGGLAIASGLLLWNVQENLRWEEPVHATPIADVQPVETPAPTPVVAPIAEVAPAPVVEVAEEPIKGEPPQVALQHEDKDTDFVEQALDEMDAGEMKSAFTSLRKHIFTNEPTVDILRQIGVLGRQVGEYAIAEQALLDAGGLDPIDPWVQIEMARLHLKSGDLDEARIAARQAIRLDNENAIAWNTAGRVAMAQYHWQRAEIGFRRAVQLDPTNAMNHNNLGLLYVKSKRGTAAVDALETAVELYGDDVPHFVFNNLGLAYEMSDQHVDARDAFEQALSANPMYSRARVNLERTLTKIVQLEEAEATAPVAEATPDAEPATAGVAN